MDVTIGGLENTAICLLINTGCSACRGDEFSVLMLMAVDWVECFGSFR